MQITEIPAHSGFSSDYDVSTDTWTLTCENNNGSTVMPFFKMNAIAEAVPDEYTALVFEYRSTHDIDEILMNAYKVFLGTATRTVTLTASMKQSDEWKTFRCDFTSYRKLNTFRFLNKAGQYQELYFKGLPVGGAIQVRNIRYDVNEFPFVDATLAAGQENIVEAENFNGSASGTEGHSAPQQPAARIEYILYTSDRQVLPDLCMGFGRLRGVARGDEAPAFLQKQYQEMWDCGFTATQGSMARRRQGIPVRRSGYKRCENQPPRGYRADDAC